MDRRWTPEDQFRAERQQAFACVMSADSYASVQKAPVTEFLKLLRKDYKPLTVYNLHRHLDAMAADIDEQVEPLETKQPLPSLFPQVRETVGSCKYGFVALDGWSDAQHFATLGYSVGSPMTPCFIWDLRRAEGKQTAEFLAADFKVTTGTVEDCGMSVIAGIGDNAANMQKV